MVVVVSYFGAKIKKKKLSVPALKEKKHSKIKELDPKPADLESAAAANCDTPSFFLFCLFIQI